MQSVVIVSAARTIIGKLLGKLSEIPATRLGATVIAEVVKRARLGVTDIDKVIMGNVLPAGLGQNPAKQAALKAGLLFKTAAFTINEVCGSGLKAVALGAQAIACDKAKIVIVGGMENMSLAPHLLNIRNGHRLGNVELTDSMIYDGLRDAQTGYPMGYLAELVAEKFHITREEADKFAFNSYQKALKAIVKGRFKKEIVPVGILDRVFDADEIPRETSLEDLAKFKSSFKEDGQVTPPNSSKNSDGAAALLITSEEKARELKIEPLVKIVAQGTIGVDSKDFLIAPIWGINKILKEAGLKKEDIDFFEINEPFSTSMVAVMKKLGLDESKVNINGGAVALGHPIGASGARILVTLFHEMKRSGAKRGLASICFGGGGAETMIVERL